MPDVELYNVDDVVDKTLYAKSRVPVYDNVPPQQRNLVGYVEPGNPVGVVYSYLAADPTRQRQNLWWMFYPASNYSNYYYAEQVGGYYDVEALRQQGVISIEEKQQKEDLENLPWYEQLLVKYGKPILIGGVVALLAGSAIKGYFSRPKSNTQ